MSDSVLIVGSAPVSGAESFYRPLLSAASYVIACDAAAEWCIALGRVPEVAVGDFDSAVAGAPERLRAREVDVRQFPVGKDESDLALAVAVARSLGTGGLVFTAAYTERLDHTLAAIGTACAAADLRVTIEEPSFRATILSDRGLRSAVIDVCSGATISVLALEAASGVSLHGLQYPLQDADLPLLSSLGLSNIALSDQVTVSLASGTLLVIASRGAGYDLQD